MSDTKTYENKRVILTGCHSGIGEATARLLLRSGAEVHGLDYKGCALELASFTHVDLRDPGSIDSAVDKIGGKVDALFNCAGLPQIFPPVEVMKVNYIGARRLTERVLPLMPEGGAIASIASTAGRGWPGRIALCMELIGKADYEDAVAWCDANMDPAMQGYSFSKEVMIVWTLAMSSQVIRRGVRMNCTLPGPTQTPMMASFEAGSSAAVIDASTRPIGRRATAEEQAGPLVFLNSDAASYVNGVALAVDGGLTGGLATGQIDMSIPADKRRAARPEASADDG
jgi:NAD(P)-dependent dehydrogenase (short-subunit alcohol dehydrogenase family)